MTPSHNKAPYRSVSVGAPLPGFTLRDTSGGSTRLWQFKQRRPVFLAILGDSTTRESRQWLATLAARRPEFDALDVAVLLVLQEPVEQLRATRAALDLPFVMLSDETSDVMKAYLGEPRTPGAAMVAADRYLQCLGVWRAATAHELPALDEPLTLLLAAEQEDCACALPAWPIE